MPGSRHAPCASWRNAVAGGRARGPRACRAARTNLWQVVARCGRRFGRLCDRPRTILLRQRPQRQLVRLVCGAGSLRCLLTSMSRCLLIFSASSKVSESEALARLTRLALDRAEAVPRLPLLHKDPFDRMLVAQAHAEALTLVTGDDALRNDAERRLFAAGYFANGDVEVTAAQGRSSISSPASLRRSCPSDRGDKVRVDRSAGLTHR